MDVATEERVRMYWNVSARGASELVEVVTRILNRARLPFLLKTISDPQGYNRCDAALLLLREQDSSRAFPLIERAHGVVRSHLSEDVPALTKPLGFGLGFAADRSDGASVGSHRAGLLADAIVTAFERGATDRLERMSLVAARFQSEGIDLERPYAPAGVELAPLKDAPGPIDRRPRRRAVPSPARLAESIATHLCRSAVWHDGTCTWLECEGAVRTTAAPSPTIAPVGADLYDGAAGIGFFLGEWSRLSGDRAARRVAIGAHRFALKRAAPRGSTPGHGYYTGWPGVVWAAAWAGRHLDVPELAEGASRRMKLGLRSRRIDPNMDLVSGVAGTILALLLIRELLEDPSTLAHAIRWGKELDQRLTTEGGAWPPIQDLPTGRGRALTGLAHGASGMVHAFLELWRATGEPQFLEVARRGLEYERRCFSRDHGNWPDYRPLDGSTDVEHSARYMTAWCHGAAGIALARIRASQLLAEGALKDEAMVGLETTRRALDHALRNRSVGLSLCHGMSGNMAILDRGQRVLGAGSDHDDRLRSEVWARAAVEWDDSQRNSPVAIRMPVGLFLGWTGIGWFALSTTWPSAFPILLPEPGERIAGADARSTQRVKGRGDRAAKRRTAPARPS